MERVSFYLMAICVADVCYVCYTHSGMVLAIEKSVPSEFRSKQKKNTDVRCAKLVGGVTE